MCPEIGFELPETVAIVKGELDKLGVEYTEKYCKSSIVCEFGDASSEHCIALRADMDALNITENTGLPFASKNEGRMHACGHDGHTAMMLGIVKALTEYDKAHPLSCRVKVLFQPSEEGMATGARVMVENGVMDDVDMIIGSHVNPLNDVGRVLLSEGPSYAANNVFKINITGKSAHGSQPQNGIDAGQMACDLYMRIRTFMRDGFDGDEMRVLNIGMINAGTAVNIVPGEASLTCTLRTYSTDVARRVMDGIGHLCSDVSDEYGGKAVLEMIKELPPLINEGKVCRFVRGIVRDVLGEDALLEKQPAMTSEDFAWYLTRKPGVDFDFGSRTPGGETIPLHNNRFVIDEECLIYGAAVFCETVLRFDKCIKDGTELPL
nr:amidohydrolase [Clostridia bacterium]